jgi:hypothetical protein
MRPTAIVASVVFLALSGCAPLNHETTAKSLLPGEVRPALDIDGPTYEQKLTVSIKSDKSGVAAYLVKKSDEAEASKALNAIKGEPKEEILLGSHKAGDGPDDYTFEATVPAKTRYVLLLRGGKTTNDVAVKVVGR